MSDREGGFVVIQRRIQSSDLWQGLRADQRGVLLSLLLLANYRPRVARWHGKPYEVRRGELSHSLEEIARHANTTTKVVRTTIAALLVDDSTFGGNGPFLVEKYPIPGTGPGTGPRVLSITKYNEYQRAPDEAGTGSGEEPARTGHGPGTDPAEREESKQRKQREQRNYSVACATPGGGASEQTGFALSSQESRAEEKPPDQCPPASKTPQAEALDHWREVVWPKLSPLPCPQPGKAEMTQLAARCREFGSAGVIAAMTEAASRAQSENWVAQNLTLLSFATTQFAKFLPRNGARGPPATAVARVIAPAAHPSEFTGGERGFN